MPISRTKKIVRSDSDDEIQASPVNDEPKSEAASPVVFTPSVSTPTPVVKQAVSNGYGSSGDYSTDERGTEEVSGILDIQHEGHGFLRPKFRPSDRDIYISASQIRRFWLRPGDSVKGLGRPPKDNERYYGLLKIEQVNGEDAEKSTKRPYFEDLTPIYPNKQMILATKKTPLSTRIIDLVSPIGFGQRGMIVSPPKAGKTTILKDIATGI